MEVLDAIVYGVLQALCEFLPISSSGHLAVLPKFLNISDPGVTFDLFLHIGTLLSLLVYFRGQIAEIASSKIRIFKTLPNFFKNTGYDAYISNMILTTFFSIFFILLFKGLADTYGRNVRLIAANLTIFGFLLYLIDRRAATSNSQETLERVNGKFCLLMGLSQAFAVFPGVSRSGATLTMGRFLKFDRKTAAEFSFLLSMPIIAIGSLYKGLKIFQGQEEVSFTLINAFIGIGVSFILGIAVIHYFLKLIEKIPFLAFFLYRFALSLIILMF